MPFSGERPSHERPDGVYGEWLTIPRDEWKLQHYLAHYTAGIGTSAMAVTVGGAALTLRGIDDICEGLAQKSRTQFVRGCAEMVSGRVGDLVDGKLATSGRVRSKPGALADSASDKVVSAYAVKRFLDAEIITEQEATWIALEQGIIAAESIAIKSLGGEPNPGLAGKVAMFSLWGFFTARVTERAGAVWDKPKLEQAANYVGTVSSAATHILSAVAIAEYGMNAARSYQQRQ